ncbi:homoprotocatechuate degradation operon regulator HpaR [Pseudomonas sp. GW6]
MPQPCPSLTLTLLQAREAAMRFFRPQLNLHDLTEQQWRVIRILRQQGELENYQLARLACILKPSMSGVLARLERDGIVVRRKMVEDQRRVRVSLTEQGERYFASMSVEMEKNYRRIQEQMGEEKLGTLLELLRELRGVKP